MSIPKLPHLEILLNILFIGLRSTEGLMFRLGPHTGQLKVGSDMIPLRRWLGNTAIKCKGPGAGGRCILSIVHWGRGEGQKPEILSGHALLPCNGILWRITSREKTGVHLKGLLWLIMVDLYSGANAPCCWLDQLGESSRMILEAYARKAHGLGCQVSSGHEYSTSDMCSGNFEL